MTYGPLKDEAYNVSSMVISISSFSAAAQCHRVILQHSLSGSHTEQCQCSLPAFVMNQAIFNFHFKNKIQSKLVCYDNLSNSIVQFDHMMLNGRIQQNNEQLASQKFDRTYIAQTKSLKHEPLYWEWEWELYWPTEMIWRHSVCMYPRPWVMDRDANKVLKIASSLQSTVMPYMQWTL